MSSGYSPWYSLLIAVQVFTLAACGGPTDDSDAPMKKIDKPMANSEAPTTGTVHQMADAPDLGSALGTLVSWSSTCGNPNQYTANCAFSNAPEVSYYWTAPCAGTFTIDTYGSSYDSLLTIRSLPGLTVLGCNDDAGGTLQSAVTVSLSAGQRVYVTVDGYGTNCGYFKLTASGSCSGTWTQWGNRDDPSGSGDWELRTDMPFPVCAAPTGVQCQTLNGIDWTQTGEVVSCDTGGFVCQNDNQPDGACQDYMVRFLCP